MSTDPTGDDPDRRTLDQFAPKTLMIAFAVRTIPKLSTRESIFFDEVHDGLSLPPSQPANEHAQHCLQRGGVDHGAELISRRRPKDVAHRRGDFVDAESC